ncbi:hypothetical protein PAXINDRAFT_20828 [Paxillus involutus ATCC 200175]|uniref:Uncharacterized protein n=1 Tax=Paxillus involutus ATCC 200175 TaxID=664439 RepID=A0A0C9SMC8_PAXIN|nr:hypothetical protein PAXINDRAFT_20828 [Paxillus involutus ATCC 200175]
MERCQEWIRRIKARVAALHTYSQDPVPNRPDIHHIIGQLQNFPVNILSFQAQNSDDPADDDGEDIEVHHTHVMPQTPEVICQTAATSRDFSI